MSRSPLRDALARRVPGEWRLHGAPGSSFTETARAEGPDGTFFIKSVPLARADVLSAEADGLQALAGVGGVRVPVVRDCWVDEPTRRALLATEWLPLAPARAGGGERLGRALAALHAATPPGGGRFGWHRDNYVGATPQRNGWSTSGGLDGWIEFHGERRLAVQRDLLAQDHPDLARLVDEVITRLPRFFDDGHWPVPSLIHGDLWSGNRGSLGDGTPVVYDPAVSVSDAEAELAMMALFGTWPAGFADAYAEVRPMAPGHLRRRPLYQLYHLLNHAVLFGGGYVAEAAACARQLI